MKWIIAVLIVLLIGLQYRLWIGEGSLANQVELQRQIDHQKAENELLEERNHIIALEVQELRSGHESIEERAREQMGMVKQGETFFMVVNSAATVEPSATKIEGSDTKVKPSAIRIEAPAIKIGSSTMAVESSDTSLRSSDK